MPMVRAYVTSYFTQKSRSSAFGWTPTQQLQYACEEIVPAGLNSEQGPLTPGSIQFIPMIVEHGLTSEVVIDIEDLDYEDRAENIEDRAEAMKNALNTIFPDVWFTVILKLVKAGWSSDTEDTKFNGGMSIEDAIERYRETARSGVFMHAFGRNL